MPKPHALKRLAAEHDEPVEDLIPRLLKEEGTPFRVAIRLGVVENTVRRWLRLNGFVYSGGQWTSLSAPGGDNEAAH